ncbi:MAG: helix-turn-helix domain-containing protein [Bradyrhizobium sp.]|nr:helix-turn-helix domain-containing protein [Bradyrhizobium sp.]
MSAKHQGRSEPQAALTVSVAEASRRLGIGRNAAYDAVGRGEIPVLRFGRLLRVPLRALQRLLDGDHPQGGRSPRDPQLTA